MKLSEFDRSFYNGNVSILAGVDEAGRGPLAGPVVAAAVILPQDYNLDTIKDSKKLSEKTRKLIFDEIIENAIDYGLGICHEDEIDKINILESTFKAMRKALGSLQQKPDLTLIDGLKTKTKIYKCKHIVKGDNKSQVIAAASIVAKVVRDKMMINYDKIYPEYGFAKHKGYGTRFHLDAIVSNKSSPIHRKSFNPISKHLPSFSYFNTNFKMHKLCVKIVASFYVKNHCDILEVLEFKVFDILHSEKTRNVLSIIVCDTSNRKRIDLNKYKNNKIKNELVLKEKELKLDIELDVILVKLSKQKPKIVIEKNVYK